MQIITSYRPTMALSLGGSSPKRAPNYILALSRLLRTLQGGANRTLSDTVGLIQVGVGGHYVRVGKITRWVAGTITMPFPKHRFRFRLRTLLLGAALIAVTFGILRSEVVGRIQTEIDANDIIFRSGPSATVAFVCRTPHDARNVSETFDRSQFIATATEHARAAFPDVAKALCDTTIDTGTYKNIFFVKYDFSRWGRYRLDLRRLCYTHDVNDPVAKSRNSAIYKSFAVAGESMALEHPLIQNCEYYP